MEILYCNKGDLYQRRREKKGKGRKDWKSGLFSTYAYNNVVIQLLTLNKLVGGVMFSKEKWVWRQDYGKTARKFSFSYNL